MVSCQTQRPLVSSPARSALLAYALLTFVLFFLVPPVWRRHILDPPQLRTLAQVTHPAIPEYACLFSFSFVLDSVLHRILQPRLPRDRRGCHYVVLASPSS